MPIDAAPAITRLSTFGRGSASTSVSGRAGGGSSSRCTSSSPGAINVAVPIRPSTSPARKVVLPMRRISSRRRPRMRACLASMKSSGKSSSRFIVDSWPLAVGRWQLAVVLSMTISRLAANGQRQTTVYDPDVNIETRKKGDVIIVDFQGRLAVGVGDELLPRLVEQLLNEGNKKILLNLSDMDYIDSNGLGELVQSLKTSKRFGASLRLLKPQDRVKKTLRLTNLLPMFSVYDSESEAIKSFAGEK